MERWFVKLYRQAGRNTRTVTFVGADPELITLYDKMKRDPTLGFNVLGYYADDEMGSMTHAMEGVSKQKTQTSKDGDIEDEPAPERSIKMQWSPLIN